MPGHFGGKRVAVPRGRVGIGRATAVRLVAEGAAVVAVDVAEDGLAATAAARDGPGRITTALCDVSSESAVVGAVRAAVAALDGLDALVNVAGIHRTTPIETLTVEDLRRCSRWTASDGTLACREAVPHLPPRRGDRQRGLELGSARQPLHVCLLRLEGGGAGLLAEPGRRAGRPRHPRRAGVARHRRHPPDRGRDRRRPRLLLLRPDPVAHGGGGP